MNDYNNETKERAIAAARNFKANYGGTEILNPLVMASNVVNKDYKKRIFLLTDGKVGNKNEIINKIESICA